jgi:DNA-binding transcriptional ArsR family regulator
VSLTDDITDPRLAKALAHPLRLEILRHLGDRTASPSEIAAEIGAPLTNVSYHVRKLRALGLIKLVRKTPKRGVVEHYYSAKRRREVSDSAWAQTPPIVKQALVEPIVGGTADLLRAAIESGGFDRADMHFTRRHVDVDEKGWKEIAVVLANTLEELKRIEEESLDRLDGLPPEKLIRSATVLALLEVPEQASQPGRPTHAAAERRDQRATSAT